MSKRINLPSNFSRLIVKNQMASSLINLMHLKENPHNTNRDINNNILRTDDGLLQKQKGVEAKCKLFEWDENTLVNLEFWDIGGQENYVQMADMFCRDAFGAILMFDASNKQSLDSLLKWKQSLDAAVRLIDNKPIPTVLVANKCDLDTESNWLMPDVLETFCKKNNILTFFYASVRRNVNLEIICYDLIAELILFLIQVPLLSSKYSLRSLGTPSEETWPGISKLPEYKSIFPVWKENVLNSLVEPMEPTGVDLLKDMLIYDPNKRISSKGAIKHPYFDDLDISSLPGTKYVDIVNPKLNLITYKNDKDGSKYEIIFDEKLWLSLKKPKITVNEDALRWTPLVVLPMNQSTDTIINEVNNEDFIKTEEVKIDSTKLKSGPVGLAKKQRLENNVNNENNLKLLSKSKKKRRRKWNKTGYGTNTKSRKRTKLNLSNGGKEMNGKKNNLSSKEDDLSIEETTEEEEFRIDENTDEDSDIKSTNLGNEDSSQGRHSRNALFGTTALAQNICKKRQKCEHPAIDEIATLISNKLPANCKSSSESQIVEKLKALENLPKLPEAVVKKLAQCLPHADVSVNVKVNILQNMAKQNCQVVKKISKDTLMSSLENDEVRIFAYKVFRSCIENTDDAKEIEKALLSNKGELSSYIYNDIQQIREKQNIKCPKMLAIKQNLQAVNLKGLEINGKSRNSVTYPLSLFFKSNLVVVNDVIYSKKSHKPISLQSEYKLKHHQIFKFGVRSETGSNILMNLANVETIIGSLTQLVKSFSSVKEDGKARLIDEWAAQVLPEFASALRDVDFYFQMNGKNLIYLGKNDQNAVVADPIEKIKLGLVSIMAMNAESVLEMNA
ncbi:hypothetical protein RND71_043497 [Anisodus tanguticus]|uniref:Non-specific serine/threonine protein kinase n=1 Tax=Anisodus tanguticus TaxID=243964 RepID=A0AAE1QPE7_9SOLA|nr:hypothetical protein RND71_043497 [Anisodus tanguticus]